MTDLSEIVAIDLMLLTLANEPRSWTPRMLVESAAKTGGWSPTRVNSRLWSFGVDGGYSGPLQVRP